MTNAMWKRIREKLKGKQTPSHQDVGAAISQMKRDNLETVMKKSDSLSTISTPSIGKPQRITEKAELEKGQPVLSFPKMKIPTRQDQDVRLLTNDKQKKLYGKVAANGTLPNKPYSVTQHKMTPQGMVSTPVTGIQDNQPARDKEAKRLSSKFGRTVLGTSTHPAGNAKRSFTAAVAGKLRSKFEPNEARTNSIKVYNGKANDFISAIHDWRAKGMKMPEGPELDAHIKNKPMPPKKEIIRRKAINTTDLPMEQQIARGKGVDATIHHEAAHSTFRDLESKHGPDDTRYIKNKLLSHVDPETQKKLARSLISRGYDARSPNFKEEMLNHIRDINSEPRSREEYHKLNGHTDEQHKRVESAKLKNSWKKIAHEAKHMTPESLRNIDLRNKA